MELQHQVKNKRSGFPLRTLLWQRLGSFSQNAPGIHWIQGNECWALRKPGSQLPWLILVLIFLSIYSSAPSFCRSFFVSFILWSKESYPPLPCFIFYERLLLLVTARLFLMTRFFKVYRNTRFRNPAIGNSLLECHLISRLLPASFQMKTCAKDGGQVTCGRRKREKLLRERLSQRCSLAE